MAESKITLKVENMNCGHCSGMVEKTLKSIPGLSGISVDLEGKKACFTAEEESLADQAAEAVAKAGYPASRG